MSLLTAQLRRRRTFGFTLIELLIVIIIIGILVAIGVPAYLQYQAKAKDTDAKAALMTAYKAAVAGDTEVNTGKFPIASTIVSDIVKDEPAASVARGDCAGGVSLAPVKQVLVDPSSTTTQITMCVRSASGAIWKLSGPLTGTPTMSDGSTVTLTWDANEMTDATRAAAVSGDGISAPDSSTGVWQGTTNLIPNGGFESGMTGWSYQYAAYGSAVVVNTQAKFGAQSLKITRTATGSEANVWQNLTLAPSTVYTYSAWVWSATVGDAAVWTYNGSVNMSTAQNTATGQWQRLSGQFTTAADGTIQLRLGHYAGSTNLTSVYFDGVQVETAKIPTPYVETNGATATRPEAHLKAPSSLLNASKGWVAARIRLEYSATSPPSGFPFIFDWRIPLDGNNRISGWYSQSNIAFGLDYIVGGVHNNAAKTAVQTFTTGTKATVIFAWDPSYLYVSAGGSAFAKQPKTVGTLTGLGSSFDLGSDGSTGLQCDCEIVWMATGTGALSDNDAATIAGWGDTDPKRSSFPSSAQATMAWDGTSASGSLK